MNLWYRQIDQITFQDVEDFCQLRLKEGMRLDYKRVFPNDPEGLVAAFANTLGGLIILGVDSDRQTNEPIWPPVGMPAERGIEERIIQICQDNIYPPVRPLISRPLDNPHTADTVIVVIRVDESPEAPHAVDQGRRIYERTGSLNSPYDLANIDRIQHLLSRRKKIEEERERYIDTGIKRARDRLPSFVTSTPLRWASVIPFFPWRDLCSPQNCRDFHENWKHQVCSIRTHWDFQRAPGGSLAWATVYLGKGPILAAQSSLNSKGHVFGIEYAVEQNENYPSSVDPLDFGKTCQFALSVMQFAKAFYEQNWLAKPGFLSLTIGLLDVLNRPMLNRPGPEKTYWGGKHFPDKEFRADDQVHIHQFLENPEKAACHLIDKLAFAFDVIPK